MGFSCGGGGTLNQVNNIASSATPSSTDIFAQYTYLGDGTIVGVSSRRAGTVSGGLNLTYGSPTDSGGGYAGLGPASYTALRWGAPGFVSQTSPGKPLRPRHRPEVADRRPAEANPRGLTAGSYGLLRV